MTKIIPILAIILVGFSVQSAYACAPEDIQHWNKITFRLLEDFEHPNLPTLFWGPFYELIVQVDPNEVNNISELVGERFGELGYVDDNGQIPTKAAIQQHDVEYSTLCSNFAKLLWDLRKNGLQSPFK